MKPNVTEEYLEAQGVSWTLPERFWRKVDEDGPIPSHMPHLGKCWIWHGCTGWAGYGQIGRDGRNIKMMPASHAAWLLYVGPIPLGMDMLHHCDNPSCVNPAHLFPGTAKDNAQDKMRKGRYSNGHVHGFAHPNNSVARAPTD